MAGEREVIASVTAASAALLAKLDDVSGRLAKEKTLADLQELVGRLATSKSMILLSEQVELLASEVKQLKTKIVELEDSNTKEHKKTRTEAEDRDSKFEEADDSEPPEWLKPYIPALTERLGWILDKDVADTVKGKVKGWIGTAAKGAKKALESDIE